MKKENGITIVALSVTIIVLLILAGISIKLVLDNNGIIGNAQTAKNQYTEAEANTEQGIGELSNVLSSNLNHNRNNGTNTTTNTVNPTPTPEPTKYTLTINAGAGTTTGSTNVQGTSGSTVTVSTPTPPSGYTVILNGNDGVIGTSSTASFKTTYSFSRWNLSGGGSISGTTYTFGNSNGTLTAQYIHTGRSLPTATRSGYTFKGWYTTATGGTKVGDAGTVYTPTSNVTIYAQWEKNVITSKLTLNTGAGKANSDTSFQGNSGTSIAITSPTAPSSYVLYLENNDGSYSSTTLTSSFTFSGWSLSGGGSISGSTYTFGDTDGTLTAQYTQKGITLTKPTRTGYTLKGWYTASSGGTKVGNGGDVYKPSANGTTIYAQWEQIIVTSKVTLNVGAGTANSDTSFQGNSGTSITITKPTAPSSYTVYLENNDGSYSSTSARSTFKFSGWSLSGGGSISGSTYTFGDTDGTLTAQYTQKGITLTKPTRTGYTLKGWYTASSGGTKVGNGGDVYKPSANGTTIYAQWEKDASAEYTLTINAGAGTAAGETSITGTPGTTVKILNPYPPSGYTITFNANNGYCSTGSLTTSYSFNRWTVTSGYGSVSGQTYTFGNGNGTVTASYYQNGACLPTATRSGYTFKGWYTYSSGGSKAGSAGEYYYPSSNITLYAQWEQVASVPDLTSSNTTFRASTTNWTNEYVTVNVSTTVSGYTLQTTTGNPTVESNWANTAYVTATSNCTVYARLTNGSTSGNYTSYNVTNIDKTPPAVMGKGKMVINIDKAKNQGYLQMNSINDYESGISKLICYYKFDGDSYFTLLDSYTYVTMNGSEKGMNGGSYGFTVTSSKINSSATGTLYMYANLFDVAGNCTKSYVASINLSTGSANYQEEVVSYSPIITQDTYSATDGPVMVTARSPQSGYTVQITMEDPTVEENWEDISYIGVYENTTVYARLKSGSTTYSYSTYNVTNINSYDYTSGRGRNTLAVDKSVNKFSYQLNSIPAGTGTAKTQTFKMYYRVKGSNGYQLKEVQESVSSGGSLRLTVEDSNLMNKKVFVYVVIINSDGTRTLVKEAWIDSSVSPWKTYYAEA